MSITDPTPAASSLIARVQGILLKPSAEWAKIDAEPATIGGLYAGYVAILAAIPVVARLVGSLVFGYNLMFISYHPSPVSAIVSAIVNYVLSLASVFILALVIDALAPSFGGQKNQIQAFKLAAYALTASWVAGVFNIYPALSILAVLGALYCLYLLYLGLPVLMKAPQAKSLAYVAVTVVVAIVLFVIIGAVTGAVTGGAGRMMGAGVVGANAGRLSGTLNLPGGSVDLNKVDKAAKSMEAAANQIRAEQGGAPAPSGAVKAVPPDTLKAMLPASLPAGFTRSEVSSSSAAAAGAMGSEAEGVFTRGDSRITLKLTDMAAMGAFASLGGALNVRSSKETATGYEKVGKVDGRMTTETFDRQAKSGKFGVIVADRFMVEARGEDVTMDELKGAVSSVGFGGLEGLARAG